MSFEEITRETIENYKHYHNPSLARLLKLSGFNSIEWEGEGTIVRDIQGKEYIDCLGGYGVFALGHRHPKVVAAVKDQLDRLPLSTKVFFNKPLGDLCKKLAEITPGDLRYSFVANSGTEAVEGALKLARLATGKSQVVYATNAFHGKTLGALSASGREQYRAPFEPLVPDFLPVAFGDAKALEGAVTDNTAAIILEPVQGEGGIHPAPAGYLQAVRKVCDERKIVFILDEVQTGFGRTGKWFACEHDHVVPDILVLAKAMGGGVMPIGAFVGNERVWECWKPNPLIHTSTFGGNPLACRAALAAIEVMQEENLPEQAARKGEIFLQGLKKIAAGFPDMIRETRGLGLMIGVEFTSPHFGGTLIPEMAKRGALVAYTLNQPKVIRFEPPLIIGENQIEKVLQVFLEALKKVKELFSKQEMARASR